MFVVSTAKPRDGSYSGLLLLFTRMLNLQPEISEKKYTFFFFFSHLSSRSPEFCSPKLQVSGDSGTGRPALESVSGYTQERRRPK